ncbi:MAG: hypothetical protein WBM78_06435 [Desulfobacterales bacterium]
MALAATVHENFKAVQRSGFRVQERTSIRKPLTGNGEPLTCLGHLILLFGIYLYFGACILVFGIILTWRASPEI